MYVCMYVCMYVVVYSEEIRQVCSTEILFKNNNYQWIDFLLLKLYRDTPDYVPLQR